MRILICVNKLSFGMGGVSTHILDLCKQYSHMDEVDGLVVCCHGGEHIPTLQAIEKLKYYEIPFDRYGMSPKGIIHSYLSLDQVILKERIDIIHVHSQHILPVAHLIKMFRGIPYLWTNHIDAIPNKNLMKLMCFSMHFPIISVSCELREMMIRDYKCNPKRCFVVNNGTDLDQLMPLSEEERHILEKEYGIDREKTPYVVCLLSRVFRVKGHMILLQAINRIPEKNKIKVIIAGHTYPEEMEYRKSLETFCLMNGIDALFLEFSKPWDVFGVSDLFVLPSVYEGFALTCIEALAMNCAVIRSRTPGWQEMCKWVEVIEINDVPGLACMIEGVIGKGFNREMTEEGREAVRKLFTKEVCAKNTLEVYRQILT